MEKKILTLAPRDGWHIDGVPKYSDNPAMIHGYSPDSKKVQTEYANLSSVLSSITSHISVPQPTPGEVNDDIIFVRDSFISNQKDTIVMSMFSVEQRQNESGVVEHLLKGTRDIVAPPDTCRIEGGDFRYVPSGNYLFAGLGRNNEEGVEFVKNTFGVPDDNFLIIKGSGYHLDTFFSILTDKDENLIGGIVCEDTVSYDDICVIRHWFGVRGLELIVVDRKYGIGSGDGLLSTNTLNIENYLIGSCTFDHKTEKQLSEMGIIRIITSLTQYNTSGGSVHCCTNQI